MRGPAVTMCVTLLMATGCDRRGGAAPEAQKPVTVVVSADTDGWIMPCGCTSNQSGGMPRRASYLSSLAADRQVVYADAGGAPAGTSDYQKLKFEAILKGEIAIKVAAHNVGRSEAALGANYLRDIARRLSVPLVSANVRDPSGALIAEPVRIIAASQTRIAITGVLSPTLAAGSIRVSDPRDAVLSAVEPLKGKYDVLIVLAYLPQEEIERLAAALPEADAVIGGPTEQPMAPRLVGPTLLASSTSKGKFIVRIDRTTSAPAPAWAGHIVEMTGEFADDPGQVRVIHSYLSNLRSLDLDAAHSGLTPPSPPGAPAAYRVDGNAACAVCHKREGDVWDHTGHSRAWQTLVAKGFEVDPSCRKCHTTGYGLPGGFDSLAASPTLVSVGCESCHGPSRAHAANPNVHTPYSAADQCAHCHDHDNSPRFEFPSYWAKIRHDKAAAPAPGGN
jgi:hypothetical protein